MSALSDDDRLLLRDAVDNFITDHYAFEERESRREQFGKYGHGWPQFAELGWLMLPFSDTVGGLGGNVIDAQVLMRAFGRGLISEPYLEVCVASKVLELCLGADAVGPLETVVAGSEKLILAHSERSADFGFDGIGASIDISGERQSLSGIKTVVHQATAADTFLVTALRQGSPVLVKVAADAPGLLINEYPTIDSRHAADLTFNAVELTEDSVIAAGSTVVDGVRNGVLFGIGLLLAEFEGIVTQLRQLTVAYLNTREQFGAKLATFQALQHKIADMVIAEEEIRSLAWSVSSVNSAQDLAARERAIRLAKARVGQLAVSAGETAVQLHGGVGVSDELVIGHYLRRAIAADAQYGDSHHHLVWLLRQDQA